MLARRKRGRLIAVRTITYHNMLKVGTLLGEEEMKRNSFWQSDETDSELADKYAVHERWCVQMDLALLGPSVQISSSASAYTQKCCQYCTRTVDTGSLISASQKCLHSDNG